MSAPLLPPTEVDVVVVGAGGAGMTRRARGRRRRAWTPSWSRRARYFGGSTARSGGGVWIPGNYALKAAGQVDADDLAQVQALPRLDRRRRGARRSAATPTSTAAPRCMDFIQRAHAGAVHVGAAVRRLPPRGARRPRRAAAPCEPVPLDARFLGDELDRLHPQYTKAPANLIVTQADFRKISLGLRTWRGPADDGQGPGQPARQRPAAPPDVRDGQRDRDRPAQGAGRRRRAGRTTTPS